MKKINQKGFGIIELILIVVAISLLAGGGWFIYNKHKSPDKENAQTKERIQTDTYSFESDGLTEDKTASTTNTKGATYHYYNIGTTGRVSVTEKTLDYYVSTQYIASATDPDASSKITSRQLSTVILNEACGNRKPASVVGAVGKVEILSGSTQSRGCYLLTAINKNKMAITLYVNYSPEKADVASVAKRVADSFALK